MSAAKAHFLSQPQLVPVYLGTCLEDFSAMSVALETRNSANGRQLSGHASKKFRQCQPRSMCSKRMTRAMLQLSVKNVLWMDSFAGSGTKARRGHCRTVCPTWRCMLTVPGGRCLGRKKHMCRVGGCFLR